MKRTISLLSILAFVLAFSTSVFAQTEVTATAEITADVTANVDANINFGSISTSQNIDATIDPVNGNTNVGTGSPTSGKIIVGSTDSQSLDIAISSTDLTYDDGTTVHTLGFTPLVYGNSSDNVAGASVLADGDDVTASSPDGDYYLYLGGTLAGGDINGSDAGTYTGDITVTITTI